MGGPPKILETLLLDNLVDLYYFASSLRTFNNTTATANKLTSNILAWYTSCV